MASPCPLRIKGQLVRPEADTRENLRLAFYDDLIALVEVEPELPETATQMGLEGMEGEQEE